MDQTTTIPDTNSRVKVTKEYTRFSTLVSNRETSRSHINNLKTAIAKNPEILQVQPILVNEKLQIIDGQHRFQAAAELGLPISYTQVDGIGIEVARAMNILQRKWDPLDFAKSYAITGNRFYEEYLKLREDYPFSHNVTLTYIAGAQISGINAKFRRGELEVNDLEGTRKKLDWLEEIKNNVQVPMSQAFANALVTVFRSEKYDHERMLAKLKDNSHMISRSTLVADYLHDVENVYNVGFSDKGRTRFF